MKARARVRLAIAAVSVISKHTRRESTPLASRRSATKSRKLSWVIDCPDRLRVTVWLPWSSCRASRALAITQRSICGTR